MNLLYKFAIFIGLIAILLSLIQFNRLHIKELIRVFIYSTNENQIFSINELAKYNGKDNKKLYLAILGIVFDVSKAADYYGPGQTYYYFVGKDATRSFISGDFEGPPRDDIIDLKYTDLEAIVHWQQFYIEKYERKGVLMGRYYNEQGLLTEYSLQVKKLLEQAAKVKIEDERKKKEFPPCNVEWSAETGSHVWCSTQSGGVIRDWVGVPRQLYETGSKESRCACIRQEQLDLKNLKEYEGCDSHSPECYIK